MGHRSMHFGETLDLLAFRDRLRSLVGELNSATARKHGYGRSFSPARGKHSVGTPYAAGHKHSFGIARGFAGKHAHGLAYELRAGHKHSHGVAFDARAGKHAHGVAFEARAGKHSRGVAFEARGGKHSHGVAFEARSGKHSHGTAFDARAGKHSHGIPYRAKHLGGFALDIAEAVRQLSDRLDVVAGKMGLEAGTLALESVLRNVLTRARLNDMSREAVEKAITEQLNFVFSDPEEKKPQGEPEAEVAP
jgi:hypothetical protein